MGTKQSNFTEITTLDDTKFVPVFGAGTNEKISKENLFDQIKDETQVFIYPTTEQLQAADLVADPDFPIYVRNEETEYRLYKITSLAAGVNDIAMDNGTTATFQEEYQDIGFVVGPATSTAGAIPLFGDTTGTQLTDGPLPTSIGTALIEAPDFDNIGYTRVNSDNSVTIRSTADHKADLSLENVDNTSDADKPISDDTQVALDLKANSTDVATALATKAATTYVDAADGALQDQIDVRVQSVATYADLSLTVAYIGQRVTTNGHTIGGIGGADFIALSGSVSDDGGSQVNSATVGIYWQMVSNNKVFSVEQFGCLSTGTAVEQTRAINKAYVAAQNSGYTVTYTWNTYAIDGTIDGTTDDSSLGTRGGIQIKSGTRTLFCDNTFTQAATASNNYSLINCSNASNFIIEGSATFIGDALIHILGTGGEFGHGLYLANSHNATISGLTIKTCWGDGAYVSDTDTTTLITGAATASSNITINDCIFTQNRRQGMSGINGTGIVWNRCQFLDTGTLIGTPPSAGVDLETDASANRIGMQDWSFNDCIMTGNGGPNVLVFPTLNNGRAGCENISFNNCYMADTSAQGSFWSDRIATYVKNIYVNGGVISGGVYSGNGTHFNNVKILKSVTDAGAGAYVIEQNATTHGAKYYNCEIIAVGDTTINSKKLFFGSSSGIEADKTEFVCCRFVAQSVYGGATNILIATSTPTVFQSCEFLTEGTVPASFVGFDNTAGSSRVGPSYSMLYDCYIDSNWHGTSSSFKGRFNINTVKSLTTTYTTNNKVPTAMADKFVFNFTGGSAVTIDAPTDSFQKRITITIRNTSAGALGALTWTAYKMAAWTQPAAGFSRSIMFDYDGTNWIEVARTAADVPN